MATTSKKYTLTFTLADGSTKAVDFHVPIANSTLWNIETADQLFTNVSEQRAIFLLTKEVTVAAQSSEDVTLYPYENCSFAPALGILPGESFDDPVSASEHVAFSSFGQVRVLTSPNYLSWDVKSRIYSSGHSSITLTLSNSSSSDVTTTVYCWVEGVWKGVVDKPTAEFMFSTSNAQASYNANRLDQVVESTRNTCSLAKNISCDGWQVITSKDLSETVPVSFSKFTQVATNRWTATFTWTFPVGTINQTYVFDYAIQGVTHKQEGSRVIFNYIGNTDKILAFNFTAKYDRGVEYKNVNDCLNDLYSIAKDFRS